MKNVHREEEKKEDKKQEDVWKLVSVVQMTLRKETYSYKEMKEIKKKEFYIFRHHFP
ncbi:MAG: hypothetical protein GF317_13640 [Candidatus Lokiarchaeota archaeon]|nr:hypothetical protein [Candidatus Lokiarchaeota archaeon]